MPQDVPTRADYVAWRTATTRWRDDDAYGHLNNATYYELFDTAVKAHLYEATGLDVRALPEIGVVAETGCRYFREIGFPEPIEMGLVCDKVGTSSIELGASSRVICDRDSLVTYSRWGVGLLLLDSMKSEPLPAREPCLHTAVRADHF